MSEIKLQAKLRTAVGGRRPEQVRSEGMIPAVLYGSNQPSRAISVDAREFVRIYRLAGESTLVDLAVDGTDLVKVLIHDVQHEPLQGIVTHVDLFQVDMNREVEAQIRIHLVGEAPAVRELGGTLVQTLEELDVRCLPAVLIPEIKVDVGVLKTFSSVIHVGDLLVPEGMRVFNNDKETVAIIEAPRSEEELAQLDKVVSEDIAAVEVEKKGKEAEPAAADEGAAQPEA